MSCWSLLVAGLVLSVAVGVAAADEKDSRLYEMRIYHAPAGKLDALHARFRDHTMKLFEKHGMTNVGYWTPIENEENKLIYVLAYEDAAAREKAWQAFLSDPDWKKAHRESEADGKLVAKIESTFPTAADYSPPIKPAKAGPRIFELRIYTATKGSLEPLHDRFRRHTMTLFARHGMTNAAYFVVSPTLPDGKAQNGADNTLVYFLAHKDSEAAKASFAAFRQDPEWIAAKGESEKNGSLTTPGGVKSVYVKPTDYSPWQ